jgi:hypothetical protein
MSESTTLHAALLVTVLAASGCAAPRVGHDSAAAFAAGAVEERVLSAAPSGALARCFETEARLLPFSAVRYEPDLEQVTYRLQGHGLWLEEASFVDRPGGGSEARFRYADNYTARWRTTVERDRLAPLRNCAGRG